MTRRVPRGRGRPSKLTPAISTQIVDAIRSGAHFDAAVAAAGVHPATAYRWIQAGSDADSDTEFREFCEAVTRARADAELAMVAAVVEDARGGAVIKHVRRTWRNGTIEEEKQFAAPNGRVALEYLARVHPGRWGRQPLELTGAGGGPVQVEQRSVVIATLADRLHTMLAAPIGELTSGDVTAEPDRAPT